MWAPGQSQRFAGWITLLGGLLIFLFWALYFSGAIALGQDDPKASEFEAAFPVADAILGITLIAAGLCLLRRRLPGPFLLVAAAAMTLYLGILDLTFYARQGLYLPINSDTLTTFAISGLCVGGGLLGLRLGWLLWSVR
jgi:hypothetical protein